MTDEDRGHGGVVGPPWSVDVLADLHAGVLDEAEAAELWPRVRADPEAAAVLDALDATASDLAGLAGLAGLAAETDPMPADVANRIDTALAAERHARGSAVSSLAEARTRRRRLGWGVGLVTAAAAVVAAALVLAPGSSDDDLPGMAGPPNPSPSASSSPGTSSPGMSSPTGSAPPLALSSENAGSAVGELRGVRDFGPLGDRQRFDACLDANGIDPGQPPEGVRPVTLDGRDGVLALYTTGELAEFRLVAVAADCGPDNPALLLDTTVGGTGG